jgi:Transposase IS66 family
VTAPSDIDDLSAEALKALVVQLLGKVTEQERLITELREENARLKGLNGRPRIKPSGMEDGGAGQPSGKRGKRRRRGKITPRVVVQDRVVTARVPPGSRFKGYETFVVQDVVLRAEVVRYRRERWVAPDGTRVLAPLPPGVVGHFGPELRRFVLAQHHQGQVTVPRLVAQLHAIGISISKRQVMRLLIAGQDGFLAEARDVLRAGLETAAWISVDDTGARHAGKNGFCTQIGNDDFAWFGTRTSKSRLVSRPEDSHLRPLAEPGVRLSPHRAPIRQRNLSYRVSSERRGRDVPVLAVQGTARPWSCDPCSA